MFLETGFDKVALWMPRTSGMPDLSGYLHNVAEVASVETGEVSIYGSLNGMKVRESASGLYVTGSLSRMLHPSNAHPVGCIEAARAIEMLSDGLHIDFSGARLSGVEIGQVMQMQHPPAEYIDRLGKLSRMERIQASTGSIYYQPAGKEKYRVFACYDKGAEMDEKGLKRPAGLGGAHLLKMELRAKKNRVDSLIGRRQPTAADLSDAERYKYAIDGYKRVYHRISKNCKAMRVNIEKAKTPADFERAILADMLQERLSRDPTYYEDIIAIARHSFKNRNDLARLTKRIGCILTEYAADGTDERISELNNNVAAAR